MRPRIAAGGLALAVSISLLPAAALGAGTTTIGITGKRHVKTGAKTTLVISGNAASQLGFQAYVDKVACARKVVKEQGRSTSGTLFQPQSVKKHFRFTITFRHSSAGTHYICAYLYHVPGLGTVRHAGFRYVTG